MKSVYYFCQSGVKKLIVDLYRLPQAELDIEVAVVKNDFKYWISTKFELLPEQNAYLQFLDPKSTAFAAEAVSNAIANRRPIIFNKDQVHPAGLGEIFKILTITSSLSIGKIGQENHLSGALFINISSILVSLPLVRPANQEKAGYRIADVLRETRNNDKFKFIKSR